MVEINWKQDYLKEFMCPACSLPGMNLAGKYKNKQLFRCPKCGKHESQFYTFKTYELKSKINWRRDYSVGEFACPNPACHARSVFPIGRNSSKQEFICQVCKASTFESIDISNSNISRFSGSLPPVKPFNFDDNLWDLRAINPKQVIKRSQYIVNFDSLAMDWFIHLAKQYIHHLCKSQKSDSGIQQRLVGLRKFSHYLDEKNITNISQINRETVFDFVDWLKSKKVGKSSIKDRLGDLRSFFMFGNQRNLFNVSQDIIRDTDFPKNYKQNTDPLTNTVREQIESNLHKLPDPIARMWIIAMFTAMRCSELAFLKKDCLVQEGEHWKIIWQRPKTNDWHEVPITRTIAKVVFEQQEYIENLWGESWEYLFCHYQNVSQTDISQPKLKPVKKVILIPSPLQKAINCLISVLDIRDDNGKLVSFSPKLLRSTRLTQLFEMGHDLAIVSAWAGHRHLATTSTYYTHVSCELIEKEAGYIQKALFNIEGKPLYYESMPKSFWENPRAHQLELEGNHINTPIYGYCGLPLDRCCNKFRACYTCSHFVATADKLQTYIKLRDLLRAKESTALTQGHDVLVEQFARQADQIDKIIASLQEEV
ncbi:tyrosine-type recombinase/integrase [Scytonema sp. NUACC26]|uniref:tyrosine-type recombinase/integrase n=1 Tax=Scytonema sp. NUACC26 TaxID=3140176 RepID=UPI0034DBD29C